jgi:hypothetical protein
MEDPMRDPDPTYCFEPKKSNTPTWRQLACRLRGKTDAERGQIGAALVTGQIPLPLPSLGVAANLCQTTPYWVQVALNGGNAHGRNGSRNGNGKTPSLAEHLLHSTLIERVEAAHAFGLAELWDEMVLPAMNEEESFGQRPVGDAGRHDRQSKAAK